MERITGNEVQSMMEAYASVYKTEEQEVISEEVAETEELQENQANRDKQRELRQQQSGGNRAQQQLGPKGASYSWADRRKFRRSSSAAAQANTNKVGQNIKVGSPTGPAQNDQLKKPTATGTPPAAPTSMANKAEPATPAAKPKLSIADRLQQIRDMRARSQSRITAQGGTPATPAVNPTPKTAPPAVPAANTAKPAAAAPAPVVKKKPAMGARNRMRMEEVDVFDTIKEYLIGEGATEKEALKQMLTLTDDERQSILELSLPRSVTVIPPANMKDPEERKAYVKQRGAAAREDIKRQDAGQVGRVNGQIPEFRVKKDPNAMKKPSELKNSYEAVGELVDEGSCGSKPKKKGGKK